jgi:hypothetical protein
MRLHHITPRAVVLALAVAAAGAKPAFAFGEDGHRIIAEIADRRLTPEASRAVRDLLSVESVATLADVASWADHIRNQRRETGPWHYVDIPVSAAAYDPARDCAEGACIVAQLDEYRAKLADASLSKGERLEALKFVVHFVGDLHQPLHASDNHDRGGNTEMATGYPGSKNLHSVWDSGIIEAAGLGGPDAARKLDGKITDADASKWAQGTITDWANESHAVAVSFIYKRLPDEAGSFPQGYQAAAEPVVEVQLEKAGVRLAAVLDSALSNGARPSRPWEPLAHLTLADHFSASLPAAHWNRTPPQD